METTTDRAVRDVSPWQLITPASMPEARERELLDMVAYLEMQVRVHAAAIEALQIAFEGLQRMETGTDRTGAGAHGVSDISPKQECHQ